MQLRQIATSVFMALIFIFCPSDKGNAAETAHPTLSDVYAERDYQRAKEAAFWSQPAMGVAMTLSAIKGLGGQYNDIAYLSQPANWKWRILTPNSVSLYATSIVKTLPNEPMVIEVPAVTADTDIFGTIMDSFQVPLVDIGSGGLDFGSGGKYLILPAMYDGPIPEGFIPVSTERNLTYFMFRVIPSSFDESDLLSANSLLKDIKTYPLNNPEQQGKHIDVYDKVFDTVDPRDSSYFDILTEFLNEETIVERDLMMMSMMRSFGYIHGEVFKSAPETRKMLSSAVGSALDDLIIMTRDIAGEWWEGNPGWMQPIKPIGPLTQFNFLTEAEYSTDARAETYSLYCCGPANLGSATAYIYASRDVEGEPLGASLNYKLHVPANVPVKQFWSLTAYDAQTSVFFEEVTKVDISSLDSGLQFNEDGSIDLYAGPQAPQGKEANWVETSGGNYAVFLFRFYGPKSGLKDGSWKLPGFEKASLK